MNPNNIKKYSIGIDIGGTNTDIGLVCENGKVVNRKHLLTQKYTYSDVFIADLVDNIKALMCEAGIADIEGVGIGAPNANYYTGSIGADTVNLRIKEEIPLQKIMQEALKVPVVVSNDANAAACGEHIYGAAKGMKHFIVFTLGTGVGSGIVIDNHIVHGSTGGAGELGHSILIPEGRLCHCGRRGCLEAYTSADGICRTYLELRQASTDCGMLADVSPEQLTCKMIGIAAGKGDHLALQTFEKTGHWLGIAMANAVAFAEPEAIFLTGGPALVGKILFRPTQLSFEQHLLMTYKGKIKIYPSLLAGNDAIILGAAALIRFE